MNIKYFDHLWILSYVFLIYFKLSKSFNLDIKTPILKTGPKGSYFGFSVAQHVISDSTGDGDEKVLLVGAPKDLNGETSVRSGSLYRCPFTSKIGDCSIIDLNIIYHNATEVNDQWLGATVASQRKANGLAVVCAPRYKKVGAHSLRGEGSCIIMTNDLRRRDYMDPCSNRDMSKGYEGYAFCQAGFSADISQDDEVLVGAPGAHTWRGISFYKSVSDDIEADLEPKSVPPLDDMEQTERPVPPYSYFGTSSKIAIMNNRAKTLFLGAPRSELTGWVLMFQRDPNGKSFTWKKDGYLNGSQFGGGFGYELVVIDFNADGLNDVVVGAPFEYGPNYGGAIYAYQNTYKGISNRTEPKKIVVRKSTEQECVDVNCQNGRFGISLANVGDIDGDGFPDLAVGAPYEGSGVVYIFRGSKLGIAITYSQRITSSDMESSISTFGYSITGGLDMDGNGYPDVVVGSYEAGSVAVLRSRPVIKLNVSLVADKEFIDILHHTDKVKEKTFHLKACFKYESRHSKQLKIPKRIKYEIKSENLTGTQIARVHFSTLDGPPLIKRIFTLTKHHEPKCEGFNVYLDCNWQGPSCISAGTVSLNRNNRDFLNPLKFHLLYQLDNDPVSKLRSGDKLNDINQQPILDVQCENITRSIHFKKNCSKNVKCLSSLKVLANVDKSEETSKNEYKIIVGQSRGDLLLNVHVTNNEEEAHEAMLFVYLPLHVKFKGTDDQGKHYQCGYDNHTVSCLIGNPMPGINHQLTYALRLDPSELKPEMRDLNITVAVNTTSVELDTSDDTFTIFLKVIVEADLEVIGSSSPSEVYFGGEVRGEGAMVTEEDIGSLVVHSYEVKNLGGGEVKMSTLAIQWPYALMNGKHLLYLLDIEYEGDVICGDATDKINVLHVKTNKKERPQVKELVERVKRGARMNKELRSNRYSDDAADKMNSLDCDRKTAQCSNMTCSIGTLTAGDSVVIKLVARLWNTSFLQDFMLIDKIRLYSKAHVHIDPSLNIQQKKINNDVCKTYTVVMPDQNLSRPQKVDMWIIIVSVCSGVLLLLLLMLLLWRCGFFKRSKPEDILVHQAKLVNQPLNQ